MNWLQPDDDDGSVLGLLATTFELDAGFFDSDYLPTFLGLGAWEDTSWASRIKMQRVLQRTEAMVVLMDARRFKGRPRSLHLEVMPNIGPMGAKQHSKVTLIVQEKAVRLFVGSANLTTTGYRSNREVGLPLVATATNLSAADLIQQALRDIRAPLAKWWTPGAEEIVKLAERTMNSWDRVPTTQDRFVWSYGSQSLAHTFGRRLAERAHLVGVYSVSLLVRPGRRWTSGAIDPYPGARTIEGCEGSPLYRSVTGHADLLPPLGTSGSWLRGTAGHSVLTVSWQLSIHVCCHKRSAERLTTSRFVHFTPRSSSSKDRLLRWLTSAPRTSSTTSGWGLLVLTGQILKQASSFDVQAHNVAVVRALVPKTTGKFVPLDGNGRARVSVVERPEDDPAWPSFMHDVRLCVAPANNALYLASESRAERRCTILRTLADWRQRATFGEGKATNRRS